MELNLVLGSSHSSAKSSQFVGVSPCSGKAPRVIKRKPLKILLIRYAGDCSEMHHRQTLPVLLRLFINSWWCSFSCRILPLLQSLYYANRPKHICTGNGSSETVETGVQRLRYFIRPAGRRSSSRSSNTSTSNQ